MPDRKVIAVMGATGAQGGGLARAIAADRDGGFAARAITRKPDSDKARALAAQGVEVVRADADDPPTLEKAFAGAHAVFCVTNYWEVLDAEREGAQATAMAKAAKRAGARHVIWSTLEDTRKQVPLDDPRLPTLHGKYKVPHFDSKASVDHVFAESGVPTTYLLAAFYWENFISFGQGPRKGEGDTAVLALPLGGAKLPGIAAEDIGRCAYGIFRQGAETAGQRIGIAGDILSGPEMAEKMGRAMGRTIHFQDVPFDVFRSLGFPGADDLGNMFEYQALLGEAFTRARDVARSRALNPALQSFDTWLAANATNIPIA